MAKEKTATEETTTEATTERQPSFNIQARNLFLELVAEYNTGGISESTMNRAVALAENAPNVRGVTFSPEVQLANLDVRIAEFYANPEKVKMLDGERFIKQEFQNEIINLERKRNALSKEIEKAQKTENN